MIQKRVEELLAENHNNSRTQPRSRPKLYEGRDIDVVFCMDSNSRHIRFKKLWTTKNSVKRRCYTQKQLKQFITDLQASKINNFLIHVGVNDTDHAGGDQVFTELLENIKLLKEKYPHVKIIIAELTPRKDDRNYEVDACNTLLTEFAATNENIFVASHETIRGNKDQLLVDNKHVSRRGIGVLVVNLKRALCEAHGVPYVSKKEYEQRLSSGNGTLSTMV